MEITLEKLIKLVFKDKKILYFYLIISILAYPTFSYYKNKFVSEKVDYRVSIRYNLTLPNTGIAYTIESFFFELQNRVNNYDFKEQGFSCRKEADDNIKFRSITCATFDSASNFEKFKDLTNKYYSDHIENIQYVLKKSPTLLNNNENQQYDFIEVNQKFIEFLEEEKKSKFFLKIEKVKKLHKFNIVYYIFSILIIFSLNVFRVVLKY